MRVIPRYMGGPASSHEVIDGSEEQGLRVLAHTLYYFADLISREYTVDEEDRIEAANDDV